MRKNKDFLPNNCPVTFALNVVGGKWKAVIIHLIRHDCKRFSSLSRAIPDISKQMLVNQLRELEADGILTRVAYAESPPRVEYLITDLGQTLLPLIDGLRDWGIQHMPAPCQEAPELVLQSP